MIKKVINLLLVFSILFSHVVPVYALEVNDENKNANDQVTNDKTVNSNVFNEKVIGLKDNTKNADFSYEVSIEDSIKMIFDDTFNYNEYFLNVLNTKINDSNIVASITNVDTKKNLVNYNLVGYENNYSGVFSYSKTKSFELPTVKEQTIIDYFKSILGEVNVSVVLSDKDYKVTINNRSEVFSIKPTVGTVSAADNTKLTYQAHVQDVGWQNYVNAGSMAGTTNRFKRAEAFRIKIDSNLSGDIQYQVHVQDIGWQSYVGNNKLSGTEGKSKRAEAIKIKLTGELAKKYHIYYKVHIQDYGWLGWAKDGEMAGSTGLSKRVEAIYIKLVKVGDVGEDTSVKAAINDYTSIQYKGHIGQVGWKNLVNGNTVIGNVGHSIEALNIYLNNTNTDGSIEYQTHLSGLGWQKAVKNGAQAGTTGQARAIEALNIKLTGSLKNEYDIYYRVYVAGLNKWLGWAKNGENAGSVNASRGIEQLQITLVKKGQAGPTSSESTKFIDGLPHINYSTYVDTKDWQKKVSDGAESGTRNQSLGIKGINLSVQSDFYPGNVQYQIRTKNSGWINGTNTVSPNGENLEAIKINLTGKLASEYNVYYRVYVSQRGWLGWAKNGQMAGSEGLNYSIEAIEIKLISIHANQIATSVTQSFLTVAASISYQAHVQSYGWQSTFKDGQTAGTTGQSKSIEALKISISNTNLKGDVNYKVNVGRRGWQGSVKNGSLAGTTGQELKLEAIRMSLSGEIEKYYDIYYRLHLEHYGWINWAKNGETAGTSGAGCRVEAIQIKLVPKSSSSKPSPTGNTYYKGHWSSKSALGVTFQTYTDPLGREAKDFKYVDGIKYFFNAYGYLVVNNAKRIIDVSSHNGVIDWNQVKRAGLDDEKDEVDGVIVRIGSWLQKGFDTQLSRNVSEMNRLNIPYGLYLYSYAVDGSESVPALDLGYAHCGLLDARAINKAINDYGMNLSYPIYYDLEANGYNEGWTWKNYKPIIDNFNSQMQSYGNLYGGTKGSWFKDWKIYTGPDWSKNALSGASSDVINRITWIAHYNHYLQFNMNNKFDMWQYSDNDRVPGISNNVDSSAYGKFPHIFAY